MRRPYRLSRILPAPLALIGGLCSVGFSQAFPDATTTKLLEVQAAEVPDAAVVRARKLAAAGQLAAAEQELRNHISSRSGDANALYELGSVLQRENKPKESLAAFTEAAKERPPSAEDLRIVALDYVLLEDYPDAVRWLERAVAGDPANAKAWYNLGRAHMMQQNFSAAESALLRSLELMKASGSVSETIGSADAVKAQNNLGVTYEGEGRVAEAASAYRTAIAWQGAATYRSEQPLLNYGKLLIDQNRSAEAIALLEEAVLIAPKDPKCHEQLARALDRSGSKSSSPSGTGGGSVAEAERAQKEMLEAIRLEPSNARLHFQLGLMYRRAGKAALSREQMALSGNLYGSHSTPTDH